jgi:CBS domain-containing protein
MAEEKKSNDKADNTQSLVETFHRAGSLIPKGQKLVTISKDTTVAEALKLMEDNHFSQLPVVSGKAMLGVFSYRSFSQEAAERQKSSRNEVLADLPVEEFLEYFLYIPPNEDWATIQRHLDEKDTFFVGHPDDVVGLVTTMDVYHYFRNIADPFILMAEIEVTLRLLIAERIPVEDRDTVFTRCLAGAYQSARVPREPDDLTLDNSIIIITSRDNWPYFQEVLGKSEGARKKAVEKLKPIPKWRNDTFHFRRTLQPYEKKKLEDCRNWLRRAVRAYIGQQSIFPETRTEPVTATKTESRKLKQPRIAAEPLPLAAEFFNWLVREVEKRPRDYVIKNHKASFSIRLRSGTSTIGILWAYNPEKLSIYFADLKLPPAELAELRRNLLAYGVFIESGKHTLNALISQINGDQLRQACLYLLNKLAPGSA